MRRTPIEALARKVNQVEDNSKEVVEADLIKLRETIKKDLCLVLLKTWLLCYFIESKALIDSCS